MLNRLPDTATPIGLAIVDGFSIDRDWLSIDPLMAVIEQVPSSQVIWCGWPDGTAALSEELNGLVDRGQLIVSPSRLGTIIAAFESEGKLADVLTPTATEAGSISFGPEQYGADGSSFVMVE
jgi:hypothetical protein